MPPGEGYTRPRAAQGDPGACDSSSSRDGSRAPSPAWPCLAALALPRWPRRPAAAQPPAPRQKPLAQSLPADAKRDYDAGKLLFEDGDYATALLKYRAAYDSHARPAPALERRRLPEGPPPLRQGGRDARALPRRGRRRSLAGRPARRAGPPARHRALHRADDRARVRAGRARCGSTTRSSGSRRSPARSSLDMGTRRVRVRKEGFRLLDCEFPVGGSAPTTVDLTLERQAGHLELNVPADAHVFVDDKEVGHGPSVDRGAARGRARACASSRRACGRCRPTSLVEDGKTRTLDLGLEPEAAPVAEVHVAVSCMGPDPLPQEDLAVFFDDATESALPLGVRIRREPGREVVAYVAYRVRPGTAPRPRRLASMRVAATRSSRSAKGASRTCGGSCRRPTRGCEADPAGSPDGWRLSRGLIESSTTLQPIPELLLHRRGHHQHRRLHAGRTRGDRRSAGTLADAPPRRALPDRPQHGQHRRPRVSTTTRPSRSGASGCAPAYACRSSSPR